MVLIHWYGCAIISNGANSFLFICFTFLLVSQRDNLSFELEVQHGHFRRDIPAHNETLNYWWEIWNKIAVTLICLSIRLSSMLTNFV